MKRNFLVAALTAVIFGLAGCGNVTMPKIGSSSENRVITTKSSNKEVAKEEVGVKKCAKVKGTAVILNAHSAGESDPYGVAASIRMQQQMMRRLYGFGDPIPLLKVIIQESGCFKLLHSRARKRADYSIEVEVPLPEQTVARTSGGLARVGSMFGPLGTIAGAIAGSISKEEVQVVLSITKRRGDDMVAFTGQSSKIGFGGGLGILGTTSVGLGGVRNSPKGEAVVAAMIHAHNQIPDYKL